MRAGRTPDEHVRETTNRTTRAKLISKQEKRLLQYNQMYCDDTRPAKFRPPPNGIGSHCRIALYPENQITLDFLTFFKNAPATEMYFIGRAITPSLFKSGTVSTIVENCEGTEAIRLDNLYHMDYHMYIPVGMILILTRPMVVQTLTGKYTLRCTDSMDIHFIDEVACWRIFPGMVWQGKIPYQFEHLRHKPTTSRYNSLMYFSETPKDKESLLVLEYKRKAKEYFQLEMYLHSAKYFHLASNIARNDTRILLNRSRAFLKIGWTALAYRDATLALRFMPLHRRTICQKSRVLSAMNKYKHGIQFLKLYGEDNADISICEEDKKILNSEKARLEQMQHEHITGDYNIHTLQGILSETLEDTGEYIGPIKIADVPEKGKGTIAIKTIKAGEIIFALKAFEIIKISESDVIAFPELNLEKASRYLDAYMEEQLLFALTRRLVSEPHSKQKFFSLYTGPRLNRVEKYTDPRDIEINLYRIREIIHYNARSFTRRLSCGVHDQRQHEKQRVLGLWIQTSFINHSCMDCNCTWNVFGDFMFIRAFKDIKVDEEILMPYACPMENYFSRKAKLEKIGIDCDCQLCRIEKAESKADLKKRIEIMVKSERPITLRDITVERMRRDIQIITSLRPNVKYNFDLILLHRDLGNYYISQEKFSKAVVEFKLAHSISTGTALCDIASLLAADIMKLLLKSDIGRSKTNAKKWMEVLKNDFIASYGTIDVIKHNDAFKSLWNAIKLSGIDFK